MKTLLIIGALCLVCGAAFAWCQTDFRCVQECMQKGYLYGLCKSQCSWCN
jgi:hypothetical protein